MSEVFAPSRCRSCGSYNTQPFYEVRDVPVNSVLLLSSREEAVAFPTGDIELHFCSDCGFIFNALYDPSLVEYSPRCEETQGYSDSFRKWHEALAQRLIQRHNLYHKEIIEIGCGKGEFLTLLCALGDNRGVGFDPAYVTERSLGARLEDVDFIPRNYASEYVTRRADFVCCKMTLEHIPNASEFVGYLRRSLEHAPDTIVFFQVPNAWKILDDVAFWDVYYEHCSYYSRGSLVRLFARHGFDVLDAGFEYADQYVTIEARPGTGNTLCAAGQLEDLAALRHAVLRFPERLPEWLEVWRQRFRHYKEGNQRVVVWGSGSKGVAFLTTVDLDGLIEYVVDINPHRQGNYMAKTGQEIVGPGFLRQYKPDVVLVMNPIYQREITTEIHRQGVEAEILTT
jgi:SAM-dependent methyltransferase